MAVSPYACECGSTTFRRYVGDKTIYCSKCGKPAPKNVAFKDDQSSDKPVLG